MAIWLEAKQYNNLIENTMHFTTPRKTQTLR
jgi:hypothetical protein